MKNVEKTYGKVVKGVFSAINPIKRKVMKTPCTVHKLICDKSIEILKNEGYKEEYIFFKEYKSNLFNGVVYADQEMRSSNHFFHYEKEKGLYGFSNALSECYKYFNISLNFLKNNDLKKSTFYLGAALHLIQDVTVPQHVNNKLLKNHRGFELWIKNRILIDNSFWIEQGIQCFNTIDEYIKLNAIKANGIYEKFKCIKDKEERNYFVAKYILEQAQQTTSGFLITYYRYYEKHNKDIETQLKSSEK